jgi:hypothetical protein
MVIFSRSFKSAARGGKELRASGIVRRSVKNRSKINRLPHRKQK